MSKRKTGSPATSGDRPKVESAFSPPLTQKECLYLATIFILGGANRWLLLNKAAVEHFDEGVYASKYFFGPDSAWPMQHLYAPPLLPTLVESLATFFGPSNVVAILPGLVCGTATVLLVWWIGRSWCSVAAGLAAAALAATNETHALLSRSVLTDVPLTLLVLAAVFAWERGATKRRLAWIIAAGFLTGLAGLTKYNGWLPVAIAGFASLIAWTSDRVFATKPTEQERASWGRLVGSTLLMLLLAALCWAPYLWSLQSQGGYAAVAQNHVRYVVGLTGWLDSASRQWANHRYLESWLSCFGFGVAWTMAKCFGRQGLSRSELLVLTGQALVLAALCALLGLLPLLVVGGGWLLWSRGMMRPTLGQSVLITGWLLLLVMTPLYFPYLRLTLPWLSFAWLAAAAAMSNVAGGESSPIDSRSSIQSAWLWPIAGLVALVVAGNFAPHLLRSPTPWQPRTGMQSAASELTTAIRKREAEDKLGQPREPTIFVFGEPALVFHLRRLGFEVVRPVQEPMPKMIDPDLPTARVWLIVGPHGERDPQYEQGWTEAKANWRLEQSVSCDLSDLILLDLYDPRQFSWRSPPREATIRLYAWKPEW